MVIQPGEIYFARGEIGGRRPVIVISREPLNRGRYVVVVGLTTQEVSRRRHLPNCVAFRAGEFGLTRACVAQAEAITSLPNNLLDDHPIGRLDDLTLRSVIKAVGQMMDADCEPE